MSLEDSSIEAHPDHESKPPWKGLVWMFRQAYRVAVIVIGFTVLLIGLAMTVLPGPAFIVIPIGLGILAQEFVWARKWLDYAKRQLDELGITGKPAEKSENTHENQ